VVHDGRVTLVRQGSGWLLSFGGQHVVIPNRKGCVYLAELLAHPESDFSAFRLMTGRDQPRSSSHAVVDDSARRAYEVRARQIVDDLTDARHRGAAAEVERLENEADRLTEELQRARALGTRSRRFVDDHERARTAVQKAIWRVVTMVEEVLPAAADHLRSTLVTGGACRYVPSRLRPR
jgi:hypothetical protein